MFTICWAAKGGSGTTVTAATLAVASPTPTLLVDLAGDLPLVLGLPDPDGPGVCDWLHSTAPAARLTALESPIDTTTSLLHAGAPEATGPRRRELAEHLRSEQRDVIVDAGTGPPPPELAAVADHRWLVTRPCYLALRAALATGTPPTGVVLIDEPGRALGRDDIEAALGVPVIVHVLADPAVARAVDAGLLTARLPSAYRRNLRAPAAAA